MDFTEVSQLPKGVRIAKGNKVDAVMSEGREASNDGCFLPTTDATGRDEHASGLAMQLSLLPEMASGIPEGLQKRNGFQLDQHKAEGDMYVCACLP